LVHDDFSSTQAPDERVAWRDEPPETARPPEADQLPEADQPGTAPPPAGTGEGAARMTRQDPFKAALLRELPSLRAFGIALTGSVDLADDLVQETVLKAWRSQDRFELGTNMRAWLFVILRNSYYSLVRRRGREVPESEMSPAESPVVAPEHDGVLALGELRRMLMRLPADQREALLLVSASGFSYDRAAEICGCAPGTIKSRVSRARAKLHEMLAEPVG
jgi:RNA polymerase sigma-70 factor, ECF subfamily